jgi:hypothetical protein
VASDDAARWWRQRHESLLSFDDIETLTGRKNTRLQCAALVEMKVPFTINVIGEPLVPRSAINGTKAEARREVKMLEERMEFAMRDVAEHHRQAHRERVKRLTGEP